MAKKICNEFARRGSCPYNPCRFAHVRQRRNSRSYESSELSAWKRQVPDTASTRSLGPALGAFFADARKLIEVDDGTKQEVIKCLSQEGGLNRIQELIQRDFSAIPTSSKRDIFAGQILPFLEIITHQNVHASLVLEQAVGTIYNCIYGIAGRRGIPFLEFLADAVQLEIESKSSKAPLYLELSLLVFWQVVELNSTAFIQEPLKPLAQRFADLLIILHDSETATLVFQSCDYLEKLQRRLDIGLSLPSLSGALKQQPAGQAPVAFVTQKDPPGGRHDNDHEDIGRIRIMPTFQEIMSKRSEYLPVKDPRQWHLDGPAGLLDRHFRLLREDTVGQLRDVIHAELQPSASKSGQRGQTRAYTYRQVGMRGAEFHRFAGLQFLVQFAQPQNVRGMTKKKQREWWEISKRLQPSALVCLVDPQGSAIFCTVASPEQRPRARGNAAETQQPKLAGSLWEDTEVASILLELVESTESNWEYILDCLTLKRHQRALSLVEFPGILLPSFQSTLLGLQNMQGTADIPMSDYLAPKAGSSPPLLVDVAPPVYSTAPGFSFDLQCLMNDHSSFKVEHSQPVNLERLQKRSTLDDAQAAALVSALQRRIALIQGPPGTGKSFTGVALIKVLLANKAKVKKGLGPIVCVCYTNHALDQLLEDLLDSKITSQIIRVGSQSKSDRLQQLNLRVVAGNAEKTRLEKRDQWQLHSKFDDHEDRFRKLRLNSAGSDQSLKYYIRRSHPDHYNQLFGVDKEGFQRQSKRSPLHTLQSWLNHGGQRSQGTPRRVEELLDAHLDTMTMVERRALYNHWLDAHRRILHSQAQSILSEHSETKASWDRVRDEMDLRCLRTADVIGVTTTGLARNLKMLRRLPSKVLLCEEAGEVLEAHLLTSLLPSLEQVILIGDHQQLRPQIQNYELSRESKAGQQYSLDRSLFERLVEPDDGVGVQIPFCTLETQRRMHPSISRLVRDTLYPRLQDAPSVSEYPAVVGMRKRLFWLDHRRPEAGASDQDAMSTSHWNDHEIQLTVALVNHLLRQGAYQSGEVAVLTPYLGQLHRLRRKLSESFTITLGERDQEDLDNAGFTEGEVQSTKPAVFKSTLLQTLRVATIDNFQGEEAKVVVISLVRSNSQNRCGFLRTPNRINVLLSRAKHGMYIIGNSETSRGVEMWGKVIDILEMEGNIGPALELSCPRHPESPITVSEPDDFVQYSPEGGCSLPCGKRLRCGHPCKQKCHSDLLHQAVYCPEPCQRPQKGCTHPCPKPCGDPCPKKCEAKVFDADRVLPCGHQMASLPCWQAQDLSTVKCPVLVKKEVPHCNHTVTVACHIDVASISYRCTRMCQAVLPCGHNCKRQCTACTKRTEEGPAVDHGTCTQKCGRLYSACAHSCSAECHQGTSCPPCTSPCDVQCGHSRCPQKCSEPCAPCAVPQCLSSCPHSTCSMPCAAPCDHVPCSLRCEKLLSCGHRCPSVCGEICPPARFCQICGPDTVKETPVDFILGETYKEIDLGENPCVFPQCGHFLTIESMDAQMDLRKHYNMDEYERPVSIASSSEPFSIDDIRTCATCRGSLRNLSRYGRLVRRALLDEATKKFILYLNQQYVPLAQELPRRIAQLRDRETTAETGSLVFKTGVDIRIDGPPEHQVRQLGNRVRKADKERWRNLLGLRDQITTYMNRVKVEEQPFNQVRNMVEDARRRKSKRITGDFEFDENVLQTKGHLQAASLLLRLDTALLADFLSLTHKVRVGTASQSNLNLHVDLSQNRKQCRRLIDDAAGSRRILQQAEGYLFLAQLCALERQSVTDPTRAEGLLQDGAAALQEAQTLCDAHPTLTQGLSEEIEGTRGMLRGSTFYAPVTNEERLAVLAAMAQEFRGTGHWYYCENGHPFTIGECGGAMQVSRCPECGWPVGGQGHQTVEGVTRAGDLEERLRGLDIH